MELCVQWMVCGWHVDIGLVKLRFEAFFTLARIWKIGHGLAVDFVVCTLSRVVWKCFWCVGSWLQSVCASRWVLPNKHSETEPPESETATKADNSIPVVCRALSVLSESASMWRPVRKV